MLSSFLRYIVCIFLCSPAATAQNFHLLQWRTENGLSSNNIYSIHQDSKGYLWVATHDGLNRYDGYEFRKFHNNPFDKKSLAGNMAIDLAEDKEGKIWVLTNTHLNLYNPSDESFERYALPVGQVNHSNQSSSKLIDAKNRFLLLNLFNGMFVFDKINKRFNDVLTDAGTEKKSDLFNFLFFKDAEGNILIGAGDAKGVLCFDSATLTFNRKLPRFYQHLTWQDKTVTSVFRNKQNNLVYCTQEGDKFYLITSSGKKQFLLNRSIDGISVFLETVSEDEKGNIWIGYGNRLFKYAADADSAADLSINLYATSITDNFIIKSICIDNFSNLWLGLYESGLLKTNISKPLFLTFSINQPGDTKLPYSSIYGLIKNPDETVTVRYYGAQAASTIDVVNKKIITSKFNFNPADSETIKRQFPQFNKVVAEKPFYQFFDASTRFTFNNGQFGLYKDRQGDFWSVNFNEFKRLKDGRVINVIHHINCFYEGDNNTFWTGSDGGGLLELNYKTGILNKFLPIESNPGSISSQNVNSIIPDNEKGLWLATGYGLNYFDIETRQFRLLSEEDGLCNNTIYTMQKDKEGKLWLGTSNGLSCYDPHTNEFINYTKNNGLVNAEYNRNGAITLANGWILMGGTEGIDVVIPDSIKYQSDIAKNPPPLQINFLKTGDSAFYAFTRPIKLTYLQNNINISFSALDFTQPANNKYQWKLDPLDKKWTLAIGKHEVNYAGLRPGNYTFKIKAAGSDGVWTEKELSFIITAPWWKSWWAIAVMIIISIAIVASVVRLYYQQKFKNKLARQKILLEKQQAIEKERTRIATDMHDDLGSGLSRIKFLSESIGMKKMQQLPFEEDINKIKEYSHEMIDKMGEIVWALNEKNDSLSDLLSYTRSYAVEYLSNTGIKASVEITENFSSLFVSGEFRRNIFLTVKEALHNIAKHSQAKNVSISIIIHHNLDIIIMDDGIGIDQSAIRPFSNGLTNMAKRIKDIGGVFNIKNENGTIIEFSAPLSI